VGRAIAEALAKEGARIAVHYNKSRRGADEVVAAIINEGGDAAAFAADMTNSDAPQRLVAEVTAHFGGLDMLVNSASVMEKTPLDRMTADQWDRIMTLNLRAPVFLALAAAREMTRRNDATGVIINMGDVAAFEAWPDYLVHSLAKSGIHAMTRGLARALAPRVRVNCIAPGAVLLPDDWPEEAKKKVVASTPLRSLGNPRDVADAVIYLCKANYVTGATIVVDGGRLVRH
jgi:pteridine reductase